MCQQLSGQATRVSICEAKLRRVVMSSSCVGPKSQGSLVIFRAPLSTCIYILSI